MKIVEYLLSLLHCNVSRKKQHYKTKHKPVSKSGSLTLAFWPSVAGKAWRKRNNSIEEHRGPKSVASFFQNTKLITMFQEKFQEKHDHVESWCILIRVSSSVKRGIVKGCACAYLLESQRHPIIGRRLGSESRIDGRRQCRGRMGSRPGREEIALLQSSQSQ